MVAYGERARETKRERERGVAGFILERRCQGATPQAQSPHMCGRDFSLWLRGLMPPRFTFPPWQHFSFRHPQSHHFHATCWAIVLFKDQFIARASGWVDRMRLHCAVRPLTCDLISWKRATTYTVHSKVGGGVPWNMALAGDISAVISGL